MFGAGELDVALGAVLLLEAGFMTWLFTRSRRERGSDLVGDAVRLGLRARRRRA
jgi:hypothetical protein